MRGTKWNQSEPSPMTNNFLSFLTYNCSRKLWLWILLGWGEVHRVKNDKEEENVCCGWLVILVWFQILTILFKSNETRLTHHPRPILSSLFELIKVQENYGCKYCWDPVEVKNTFGKSGTFMCIEWQLARGTSKWPKFNSIHVTVLVGASAWPGHYLSANCWVVLERDSWPIHQQHIYNLTTLSFSVECSDNQR